MLGLENGIGFKAENPISINTDPRRLSVPSSHWNITFHKVSARLCCEVTFIFIKFPFDYLSIYLSHGRTAVTLKLIAARNLIRASVLEYARYGTSARRMRNKSQRVGGGNVKNEFLQRNIPQGS